MNDSERSEYIDYLVNELIKARYALIENHPTPKDWIDDVVFNTSRWISEEEACSLEEKRQGIRKIFESVMPCVGEQGISDVTCNNCNIRYQCHTTALDRPKKRQLILNSIHKITKVEHDDFAALYANDN